MQGGIEMVCARQSTPSLLILHENVPFARDTRNTRKRAWMIDKAENVKRKLYGQVCEKVALKKRRDTGRNKK
jgi:hypothetical protein